MLIFKFFNVIFIALLMLTFLVPVVHSETIECTSDRATINKPLNINGDLKIVNGNLSFTGTLEKGNIPWQNIINKPNTCGNNQYVRGFDGNNFLCKNIGNIQSGGSSQWITNDDDIYYDSGHVGIGTTSPLTKLHVEKGEVLITSDKSYYTHFNYQNAGDNYISTANNGTTYFRGSDNRVITMTVKGDGRVGIGDTKIDYLPEKNNWNYALVLNGQDTTSIGFHDSGVDVGSIRYKNRLFTIGADDGWGTANTYFAGNVGIGTTEPKAQLDVAGTMIADRLVEVNGYVDVAKGLTPTITGGELINGGPTFRGDGSIWFITNSINLPQSLTIDFGVIVEQILHITFGTHWRTDARFIPSAYTIEHSTDGQTWTTDADVTGNTNTQIRHSVSARARYIKLIVKEGSKYVDSENKPPYAIHIAGLQVLANDGSALYGTDPWAVRGNNIYSATTGNVGIWTNDPKATLDVNGTIRSRGTSAFQLFDGTTAVDLIKRTSYNFGYGAEIAAGAGLAISAGDGYVSSSVALQNTEALYLVSDQQDASQAIKFITNTQDGWASRVEAMTILGNGNVGIGTTDPTHRLTIAGAMVSSSPGFDKLAVTNIELFTPESPGVGDGIITLHHGNVIAHQLRYNSGTLFLEKSSRPGYGSSDTPNFVAGGNIAAGGNIVAKSKQFEINHPIKPNMKLIHSSLEGPEIAVYYRGEGKLINNSANIILPEYFEALTRKDNRSVQLTPQGDKPYLLSASQVVNGSFNVYGDQADGSFWWQVTAVRADIDPLQTEKFIK